MSDFPWIPNYVLPRKVKYITRISEGETGKERMRSKRSNGIYGFSLSFKSMSRTDADALWAFYIAKKGAATTFTWTNPIDSVEYTVRFDGDDFEQGYYMFGRYNCQVGFRVITT